MKGENTLNTEQIYEMAKNFASRIDARGIEGQPCAYELTITGAGGGIISAEIKNDRITIDKRPRPDAVCAITASADTIAALLSGKLKPMQALMTGRIKVRGDISAVMKLTALFR